MDTRLPPDERDVNAPIAPHTHECPCRSRIEPPMKTGETIGGHEMNSGSDRLHFARERWSGCRRGGGRCRRRGYLGGAALLARTSAWSSGREPPVGRRARGSRPSFARRASGAGPDPQFDAGRSAAVRRRLADGVRERRPRSSPWIAPGSACADLPAESARDDPSGGGDGAY
jgi:hypothetical protein